MNDPLVLLSGTLCDARLWEPILARSGKAGAIIPDVAGHRSARALAEAVLAALPRRFAVAGFSLGGFVALEMIALAPSRVTALALLATSARPLADAEIASRRARWTASHKEDVAHVVERDLWPKYVAESRQEDAALRACVLAMARDMGRASWERQFEVALTRRDMRNHLAAIQVPTLVMTGAEDQLCPPEHAAEMATGITGASLEILPGIGHFVPLEAPDRAAQGIALVTG